MRKILVLLTGILLVSCGGTNTTIVSSWKDPETTASKEQFKKIMVVALLKNETTINRILKFHMGRVFRNKMTIINYDYICYNRKYFYEEKTVS